MTMMKYWVKYTTLTCWQVLHLHRQIRQCKTHRTALEFLYTKVTAAMLTCFYICRMLNRILHTLCIHRKGNVENILCFWKKCNRGCKMAGIVTTFFLSLFVSHSLTFSKYPICLNKILNYILLKWNERAIFLKKNVNVSFRKHFLLFKEGYKLLIIFLIYAYSQWYLFYRSYQNPMRKFHAIAQGLSCVLKRRLVKYWCIIFFWFWFIQFCTIYLKEVT